MKERVSRVCIAGRVSSVGLGAIATALIPFASASYAQTARSANIDGAYLSGVANICSFNEDGTFTPAVWDCVVGAVNMTLVAQTGRPQPTLDGAYLRAVGDYCAANTAGSFTPAVWDCMAESVVNDIPFRQGVGVYCSYVYGFNTLGYRACIGRFTALKQDCYSNFQFFSLPENAGFCQAPSMATAVRLYPPGQRRGALDVRRDRYLTSQCNTLPPAEREQVTVCRAPGQALPQPQPFVTQPSL